MVFNNISKFTEEEALSFFEKLLKKDFYKKLIFPGVLVILSLIIIILSFTNASMTNYMTLGFGFLFASLFFLLYNFVLISNIKKNLIKKNPELKDNGLIYEFILKEESFSVITKIGNTIIKNKAKYSELYKIIKKNNLIILKFSTNEAVVIKKEGFTSSKDMDLFLNGLTKHKIKIRDK